MPQAKPTKTKPKRPTTPITVSIGPMPEWNHLGLSSLVPKKRLLLVPSQDTDCVSIVDLEDFVVAATIEVPKGAGPWHVKAALSLTDGFRKRSCSLRTPA